MDLVESHYDIFMNDMEYNTLLYKHKLRFRVTFKKFNWNRTYLVKF